MSGVPARDGKPVHPSAAGSMNWGIERDCAWTAADPAIARAQIAPARKMLRTLLRRLARGVTTSPPEASAPRSGAKASTPPSREGKFLLPGGGGFGDDTGQH